MDENIVLRCKRCGELIKAQTQRAIKDRAANTFIGKGVKLSFEEEGFVEHLWVIVTRVDGDTMFGIIDNDPVWVNLEHGSVVAFRKEDIEDFVLKGQPFSLGFVKQLREHGHPH